MDFKLTKFLLIVFLISAPLCCYADGDGNGASGELYIKPSQPPKGNRPRIPSIQCITATVDNGMLYIDFAYPEGECQLIVTDRESSKISYHYFDSGEPTQIYIGNVVEIYVVIETAAGNTYCGGTTNY